MEMFCYQCEQTARGTGCTSQGVCGKGPETAALQDVLVHLAKGIAQYAHKAAGLGATDREVDVFLVEALFTTVTNVNFDPERVEALIREGDRVRSRAAKLYEDACTAAGTAPESLEGPAICELAGNTEGLAAQALQIGIAARQANQGETVVGLQELLLYGLKGMAAYVDHAHVLGREDDAVYAFIREALAYLATSPDSVDDLTAMCMRCGQTNLRAMELLDAAHTETFGHPEPTPVRTTPVAGKAILVSGHDLHDLKQLLEQTEGKGISVYTHGEMLPAHGYPELRKHAHLVGNYGGAWQDQRKEFPNFPGAFLFTTNCIQKPMDDYAGRLFTTGLVAWPGIQHIEPGPDGKKDFTPVIEAALAADGFAADEPAQRVFVGFGHHAVLGLADTVVEAVRAGQIRRFFLIGGCDGAKPGRNYYTELADSVPDDCVILTLACGKYRFNKHQFGDIGGVPRLLDIGQCNDAYSAIKIAAALAEVFGTDVNGLPLSIVLSWYEQKAVAILLTLLSLGIKGMRIGPSLPAFLAPPVLDVLVNQFGLTPIGEVESDLQAMLAG